MFHALRKSLFFRGQGLLVSFSLLFVFLGSVGLDQISKHHMHSTLLLWEDETDDSLFRGKKVSLFSVGEKFPEDKEKTPFYFGFNFQYSRNKGAAFSMLHDLDDAYRVPLFYAITLIAVVLIVGYLKSTPVQHTFTRYGLIMVLSGAIGNFLDRLHRGYVVDFIDVDWNLFGWRHDFAIFNIADVAINIGVICLILDMVLHRQRKTSSKHSSELAPASEP